MNIGQADKIITKLHINLTPFNDIKNFSNKPGIYAIGYNGDTFPWKSANDRIKNRDIIYIGKTESRQRYRDLNTHFRSGRTGGSTLRRTLGAILLDDLLLNPIPRSNTEKSNKRFINYKFDNESEEKITRWMKENLSLSFYEFNEDIRSLGEIEADIINIVTPILNLSKNYSNPLYNEVKSLRSRCIILAKAAYISNTSSIKE